jgi:hypothetical protein
MSCFVGHPVLAECELTTNRSDVISPVCSVQEVMVYKVYSTQSTEYMVKRQCTLYIVPEVHV